MKVFADADADADADAGTESGPHRFTVDEYVRFDVEDTELIDGVVYDVSPQSALHARTVLAIVDLLRRRFGEHHVLPGGGIRLEDRSLVEPDVLVAAELPADGWLSPEQVLLVVEVALSTWAKDTGVKLDAYARGGIAEYWVVDPRAGGRLVRHTEPDGGTYLRSEITLLPEGLASLPG